MEGIFKCMHNVTLNSFAKRIFCILVILSLGHSIQTNNDLLDVSKSLNSTNNNNRNVTRLKGDLQPLLYSSDSQPTNYNNKKKLSTYKKSLLFSTWSSWSVCDNRCKQKRSRKCLNRRKCGSVKQIEERTCEEPSCSPDNDKVEKNTHHKKRQRKKPEADDPYAADDEDDDYLRMKRHNNDNNFNDFPNDDDVDDNRIVMKVVKQGDYRHKQFHNQRSGSADIEQEFFLPRNVSLFNNNNSHGTPSMALKSGLNSDNDDSDDEEDEDTEERRSGVERGKTKAVFEVPRKPAQTSYTKWSRWSRCSAKCVTRRFKKCRPNARHICGNDVIREIAYCYTEGSFCEEWIHSQINRLSSIDAKTTTTTTTTTTRAPRVSRRRTESPLSNTISPNFYGNSNTATRRKDKMYQDVYSRPQNLQCGFPSIRNKNADFTLKIIGGKIAKRGAWPWQVAILNRYKEAFCGGTLISPNWILTASHCVRKRLYVILGEHNLNVKEGSEIEFKIQSAIKHPKYNKKTVDSDIAMLKLPQSVERTHFIGFACLPEKSQLLPVGHTCTVTGWGKRKHSDDSGTSLLHEADVPIISNEQCRNVYRDYVITKNMFCAGGHRRDTCSGDSGGGLICRQSNRPWTIYGITSFGDGCGKKNKFGIYTKLTNYVDFIWSIVNCNGLCENVSNNTI